MSGGTRSRREHPDDMPSPVTARRVAVVLAAVLTACGFWASTAALALRLNADDRTALGAGEVTAQVRDGLQRAFSYDFERPLDGAAAARQLFTGSATTRYEELISPVRDRGQDQRVRLATRVVRTGVTDLDGDRAELLVFLDQSATRADTGATSASGARLHVQARRSGPRWLVTDLRPE
ncbi:hypothetical protein OOZ19_05080 [Saccharopolyspora sp. NFXS83]|uniref:hypothetical protein n=1 Tax=Saccharopolyspora sp. NFXS83 TaxID=2993560 RepID=UPI00224B86A1|nr:hypothetical protein [Saccharopolyspora sp. NFXS83]MCX2729602.1 hypothetical protein [Saccharopolyspora sp. NFXS83]